MLNFDEINDILNDMAEAGIVEPMVEPIDDPSVEVNFWDWADVVGAVDDFIPEEYTHAQCDCVRCVLGWLALHHYHCEGLTMSYEYDDFEDYYGEQMESDYSDHEVDDDSFDDSMDGDAESALASAGWGTDEDYGCYGEDLDYQEDFHADEAAGFVDYNEDGPYND